MLGSTSEVTQIRIFIAEGFFDFKITALSPPSVSKVILGKNLLNRGLSVLLPKLKAFKSLSSEPVKTL